MRRKTYSFVVKAFRNASSIAVRAPCGRIMANLVKMTSVGDPSLVLVVANTFCTSRCDPRGIDCMRKKMMEQKSMLSDRSTLGGRAFDGGRVRYAVFNAL